MNVAIIGCGSIAERHAKALKQEGQTLVAAISRTEQGAADFAAKWNVPYHGTDMDRALSADIDVVHICTPPMQHFAAAKRVLQSGKHILCEKPLCMSGDEAKALYELSRERDVLAAVDFNVRYHNGCVRLRELVAAEDFGSVYLVHGGYMQEFHALPAMYMWRYMPERAGKMRAVTEIGSHWIDLARYVTGLEIQAVSATLGKFNAARVLRDGMMYPDDAREAGERMRVESDDAAAVTLRFANGALGCMLLSEISHGRSNHISLEVTGAHSTASWCSEDPYRVCESRKFSGTTAHINAFSGGFPETYADYFHSIYSSLTDGSWRTQTYPSFYDGYRNAAVCEAIFNSSEHDSEWTEVI